MTAIPDPWNSRRWKVWMCRAQSPLNDAKPVLPRSRAVHTEKACHQKKRRAARPQDPEISTLNGTNRVNGVVCAACRWFRPSAARHESCVLDLVLLHAAATFVLIFGHNICIIAAAPPAVRENSRVFRLYNFCSFKVVHTFQTDISSVCRQFRNFILEIDHEFRFLQYMI